tara:strand:- start:752 stop:1024 length:273 start_codon:yes stop_codon:yes gene_type:complete
MSKDESRRSTTWKWVDEAAEISPAQIRALMAKPVPVFNTAYFRQSGKTMLRHAQVMCEHYLDWLPMGDKVPAGEGELRTWALSRALSKTP